MTPFPHPALRTDLRTALRSSCCLALLTAPALSQAPAELLRDAKLSLTDALTAAIRAAGKGVAFEAELERERGRTVYSIDIVQGTGMLNVLVDAADGSIVDRETEAEDHSQEVAAARVPLADAIGTALLAAPGKAVHARLALVDGAAQARIVVAGETGTSLVIVDAVTGKVASAGGRAAADAYELDDTFTAAFGEDPGDLGPTGTNPWFVLEPGWTIELAGKKGEDDVRITVTVLDTVREIAGVRTRAVEEKEFVNGQIRESTRDYFAISRKTNSVYYFGEDVDVYEDGKLVGHEGAWLAGEKGARFGMFMPGVPLLGARYYQEIAPGVAMDKAEITSLDDTLDCPAGRFTRVLRIVETNDLEPGVAEPNLYVRGIGVVMDDGLELTRYGKGR